ncbi:MAG: ClC family H(+)/Cl(-) exchange transporter, partial [Clostridium sp.]|nr:ClC family H(+)/Cl(-) exchange transporter [Clostridium sp.]
MQNNLDILTKGESKKVRLVLKSLIVGIIASIVTVLYRFALAEAENFSFSMYSYVSENPWTVPLLFIGLALTGFIVGKVIELEPFSSGSGIPQVKAIMAGYLKENPITVILAKF